MRTCNSLYVCWHGSLYMLTLETPALDNSLSPPLLLIVECHVRCYFMQLTQAQSLASQCFVFLWAARGVEGESASVWLLDSKVRLRSEGIWLTAVKDRWVRSQEDLTSLMAMMAAPARSWSWQGLGDLQIDGATISLAFELTRVSLLAGLIHTVITFNSHHHDVHPHSVISCWHLFVQTYHHISMSATIEIDKLNYAEVSAQEVSNSLFRFMWYQLIYYQLAPACTTRHEPSSDQAKLLVMLGRKVRLRPDIQLENTITSRPLIQGLLIQSRYVISPYGYWVDTLSTLIVVSFHQAGPAVTVLRGWESLWSAGRCPVNHILTIRTGLC